MPRYTTLAEISRAGLDLRIWCYLCEHSARLDPAWILQRFAVRRWPTDIDFARRRLRCANCGTRGALILPATPRKLLGDPAEQAVAAYFHLVRNLGKQKPDSPAIDRAIAAQIRKSRNSD